MKKLLLSLMAIGAAYCVEIELPSDEPINSHFTYMSYGAGLPGLASINIARRRQKGHHGIDVGVGCKPTLILYDVHGFANYLYYPKPDLESQIYYRLGVQGGGAREPNWTHPGYFNYGYTVPQLVIGKSYAARKRDSQNFMQFTASIFGSAYRRLNYYPNIEFSWGKGF